jgi:hypothetical protein
MSDRATSLEPASLQTAGSATSHVPITTPLESNYCTNMLSNLIRIMLLRKNIGGHPFGGIMLLRRFISAKASRMSTYANAARNSRGICTYDFIGLKVPVESTLAKKSSWG